MAENNNQQFNRSLQKNVQDYIQRNGRTAGIIFWLKASLLLSIWFFLYILLVFYSPESKLLAFSLSIIWGVCSLFIIFNIGHDATHGVISQKKYINNLLQYTFNLVGANAYSWKLKHNIAHHMHTNIEGRDFDTNLSPLMRLSPETPHKKQYYWQHLTVFIVYPMLSLLIIIVGDFKIFFQTKTAKLISKHPLREWIILIGSKIYYIVLIAVLPVLFGPYTLGEVLASFLCFQLLNGVIISMVFMPSHYFPGAQYYSQSLVRSDWVIHQINTTMDISPNNYVISLFLGGLNLNISHHLLPTFCHTHYFKLSKIIKSSLDNHEISYYEMSYPKVLVAHYKHLLRLRHDLV